MLDDAADVVDRDLGKAAVLVAGEDVLAVLRSDWFTCMPLPLSPTIGFGMNVAVLPYAAATLWIAYFRICTSSAFFTSVLADDVDLSLAAGGDFRVVHFDLQAQLFHRAAHGGAQVLVGVDRRDREIAALDARAMSQVAAVDVAARVPCTLRSSRLRRSSR